MSNPPVGFRPSTLPNLEEAQKVGSLDPRLSRTDYFDGRLLTATDLIRDQTYVDERALEVGRALGSGVVRGLAVELSDDKRYLRVNPGLAISESGRVLEVTTDKALEIDLYDRALLTTLNNKRYRRFNRGLYAVTLQYVEMGSDSAESYPADPAEKNEFQYDSFVEGAEITLTPLRYPLPSDNELVSRSTLVQHFLRNPGQPAEISDQAIGLAVLAINNDRPQWLDTHLLRRPMRPEHVPAAWQIDLHRHYLGLLDTVMLERSSRSQDGEFSADQYFHLLPPAGVLPMAGVDPVSAAQYFFPDNYEVSISPVRYEDLAVIQSESMQLAPLDLDRGEAAEIMVLAPMTNQQFMDNARRLGFEPKNEGVPIAADTSPNYWLHATDLLQLRLAADTPAPEANATKVWKDIWNLIGQSDGLLHYVRRPARAAETQVSAVVLAHGFEIPDPADDLQAQMDAVKAERDEAKEKLEQAQAEIQASKTKIVQLGKELDDALAAGGDSGQTIAELQAQITTLRKQVSTLTSQRDAALLARNKLQTRLTACQKELQECRDGRTDGASEFFANRDNISFVLRSRGERDDQPISQLSTVIAKAAPGNPDIATMLWDVLAVIPPSHNQLLWPTLEQTIARAALKDLHEIAVSNSADLIQLGKAIARRGADWGLPQAVIDGWAGNAIVSSPSIFRDLQSALDQRSTTDPGIRKSAAENVAKISRKPRDMEAADNIVRNVGPVFDEALWPSLSMSSGSGTLQQFDKLVTSNTGNLKELGKAIAKDSADLGIDRTTARLWLKDPGRS